MTHTTSDESLHEPLDPPVDESVKQEPKQPQSPKMSWKGWGLLVGGVLLLTGGTWFVLSSQNRSPQPSEIASTSALSVDTLTIRSQSVANTLELSGSIRPVEQATLSTRVMGRITQLSLETGDRFRKGDILTRIDVMDITAQTGQAQLGVAQAQAGQHV